MARQKTKRQQAYFHACREKTPTVDPCRKNALLFSQRSQICQETEREIKEDVRVGLTAFQADRLVHF